MKKEMPGQGIPALTSLDHKKSHIPLCLSRLPEAPPSAAAALTGRAGYGIGQTRRCKGRYAVPAEYLTVSKYPF